MYRQQCLWLDRSSHPQQKWAARTSVPHPVSGFSHPSLTPMGDDVETIQPIVSESTGASVTGGRSGQCRMTHTWCCEALFEASGSAIVRRFGPAAEKHSGHSQECPVASFVYISCGVYRSNTNLLCRDSISANSVTSWLRPYSALSTDRASTVDLPDSIFRMEPHH